jgi:hypothetical protein
MTAIFHLADGFRNYPVRRRRVAGRSGGVAIGSLVRLIIDAAL